ncbi:MAG: DUF1893 domain-containing protein [Spirochaetales bacterium]|nr:DUF1893 domain-containing protein [Spirochaetales bacterium]
MEYAPLPEGITCRVFLNDQTIFESPSHWLHPLFELRDFLESHRDIPRENLFLSDRIIGRAAALMIVHLGIRRCTAPLMSERALPVFKDAEVSVKYEKTLPRLSCVTEEILEKETDPAKAWRLLEERARKAKEAKR